MAEARGVEIPRRTLETLFQECKGVDGVSNGRDRRKALVGLIDGDGRWVSFEGVTKGAFEGTVGDRAAVDCGEFVCRTDRYGRVR